MAKCTICGDFTKYDGGLCLKCFNDKKNEKDTLIKENPEETIGLKDKD